jgi:hypothetical protein
MTYRASFARDFGLAYQITKKPTYALKAKEALLNMDVGTVSYNGDRANALGDYALAYDWVQPTLDPATDMIIRDKLATLADRVYKDLNGGGTSMTAIDYAGYHGQAYPLMGVAGAALYDYTNPNHLALKSTPADWKKVGTEYLFENDKLHSYGRSMFSFGFDEDSGKHLTGAYKSYVINQLALWFQVSDHVYGENLLEKYPTARKAVLSETWESLPNQYGNNYATGGNTGWTYQKGIVSLLSGTDQSAVLNHIDRIEKSSILPYSSIYGGKSNGLISSSLLYCVYGNYASIPRTFPTNTSYFNSAGIYQVFRGNWNDDSDWLSLVTFNKSTTSNRDMLHGDQLSLDYYSRGDLLLADGGEDKYVFSRNYGEFEIHHNTIALENPRSAFPVSPWSGSSSAGIYKGNAAGMVTPSTVNAIVQMPWMQFVQAQAKITKVGVTAYGTSQSLTSPVNYERTVLYPDSDYFIIVDRMEGSESWVYRNIFRPTSLSITPTTDANKDYQYPESEVGHVNGALTIGSTPYNWLALPYKTETATGITTNSLTWSTTNPYGNAVTMNLVSAPASEILIEKNVGRIAGYDAPSEVFSPVIWFRTPAAASQYRVTALLSRYTPELAKTATEIPVSGTGHALKVSTPSYDDYIYTGTGTSSFAGFSTDADTVFIRKQGSNYEYTLLHGSFLKEGDVSKVNVTRKIDLLTLKQEGKVIKFKVKGEDGADIRMEQTPATNVIRDGSPYAQWTMENTTTLKITTTLSEHDFEVSSKDLLTINPIPHLIVNASEKIQVPLNITYTGSKTVLVTSSNLPKYSSFDTTSRVFSWMPYKNQTGDYKVSFNATDGILSDSMDVLITVNAINQAPVFEETGNKNASVQSTLRFTVNAADPDGDVLTYSATGIPANATFNPASRTFTWTPYKNQTGDYKVNFNVTDGSLSDSMDVVITAVAVNHAPVIEEIGNKTVSVRSGLQFTINATDSDGDTLTYSATGVPSNATFSPASRTFSWTPNTNQTGNFTVTFGVTDGSMAASHTVVISVVSVNNAPYFIYNSTTTLTYNEGKPILVNINAADKDNDVITYSATNLPKGVTVDSATHKLSWTPGNDQAGTYNITLIISDGRLQSSKLLRLIILDNNHAPVFGPLAAASVNQGEIVTMNVTASDPEGDALTYSASNLPTGATFNPTVQQFIWSPTYNQEGNYTVTFSVTDGSLAASCNVMIELGYY